VSHHHLVWRHKLPHGTSPTPIMQTEVVRQTASRPAAVPADCSLHLQKSTTWHWHKYSTWNTKDVILFPDCRQIFILNGVKSCTSQCTMCGSTRCKGRAVSRPSSRYDCEWLQFLIWTPAGSEWWPSQAGRPTPVITQQEALCTLKPGFTPCTR
jgi:hypothetical protein